MPHDASRLDRDCLPATPAPRLRVVVPGQGHDARARGRRMLIRSLAQADWTVRPVGDLSHVPPAVRDRLTPGIAASVPGCVHTDLMTAGLLPDPYLADNELKQVWVGDTDWSYTCAFTVDETVLEHDRVELACDGLDTIAVLRCNGIEVGRADNMHAAWRYDLHAALRPGPNSLEIDFAAPRRFARDQEALHPGLPRGGGPYAHLNPHNLMRKMACNLGWDWGPDLATCGVWRAIRLEAWSTARLEHVRPLIQEATARRALVHVHADVDRAIDDHPTYLLATLVDPDGVTVASARSDAGPLLFEINHPRRWWPVGHGDQPLYTLSVALHDERQQLDAWSRRIGLRTIELDTTPDAAPAVSPVPPVRGETMTLKVNGKPVYCKGANWIPDDCFPHRVTTRRYRRRIEQALDANMNMLRVWGGGLYEDEAFYDTCDELGVMVWQDFLFACSVYPETPDYQAQVEREARRHIARLAAHASLVLWNGNNECVMGVYQWDSPAWKSFRDAGGIDKPWGLTYYLDMLPRLLAELDPTRPYWPASPYSGNLDRLPNEPYFGNMHIWDVWHGKGQYRNYLCHTPRFASEFGYHAPPCYATVARAIPQSERWWNSPTMQMHNKNEAPGQEQTNRRMADDFDPPTGDYDAWHYLAQVMQARALSMGIEWFRALHPWNSGALFWQLNDCWPCSSWSAIDGDGRAKPLLHAARRFFAPRLLTIKPAHAPANIQSIADLAVYLHNDSDETWAGDCTLRQLSLEGITLDEHTQTLKIPPRSVRRFAVPAAMLARRDVCLAARLDDATAFWWFAPDKELTYPESAFDAELVRAADGYDLTIRARSLLRDLCVFPDRLDPDATVDEGCVTLLPGDTARFHVATRIAMSLTELTAAPVLRCVNPFGRPHASSRQPRSFTPTTS